MSNQPVPSELATLILNGMRKAVRKVIEESAAQDESLAISEDGIIKEVPAKELLEGKK